MKLPKLAVNRPVLTVMATLIVVVLGAVALGRLQIDLLPDVELPRVSVRTDYPGASPEVVESLVTKIIEEIVSTVAGVEEITSESSEGRSNVRLTLATGMDVDAVAIELQSRLEAELNELPDEAERPSIRKFDIASFPVVIVGVSSELDPVELTEVVENQIRDRFSRISGVAQIDPWGSYSRELRVEIDPQRLQALDLAFTDVTDAIRESNVDLPVGTVEIDRFERRLRAPSEFQSIEEIADTVVAERDGTVITLGQIAEVKDTYAELTRRITIDGKLGLRLAIRKESQANTVEVASAVLEEIQKINRELPQVQLVAVSNQGNFIERSISNVARSVLYGGVLAILVLLFFLRNLRSTGVIAVAIPICVLATLASMFLGGLTVNLMTLGGLALGVGMMVDNSIVVLENIFRRSQQGGEAPEVAAVSGTQEVSGAIIASTITTLVIFLPLIFVRGVTGMLFTEFAIVVVIALASSLVVALTLVPMLASKLLKPRTEESPGARGKSSASSAGRWIGQAKQAFGAFEEFYLGVLRSGLRHRLVTLFIAVVMLGLSLFLVPLIGSEFLPASDEGEVKLRGDMEVATRLDLVARQAKVLEKAVIAAVPELDSRIVSVNDQASLDLLLVPTAQRNRSNEQIADEVRDQLEGTIPGMRVRVWAPKGQNLLNRILPDGGGLRVEIRGPKLETLDALARQVVEDVADVDGVEDLDAGRRQGVPQQQIRINRDKVADVGLTVRDVSETLETAVGGRLAGEYRAEGFSYPIRVKLANARHIPMDELLQMNLRTPGGAQVALGSLVSLESGRGPRDIDRKEGRRITRVDVVTGGRDEGSIAEDMQRRLDEIPRPPGYDLTVAGSYEEQQESAREMRLTISLALLLVYMVLASQYESLRDPLVVMLAVPMAAIGVLVTLFMTETTLNIQSYIGCIMLAGIVVNNAILLVDQAGQLRKNEGVSSRDAVVEAGRRRLRPILMTSATTMLGLLPLALGIGEGADGQAPLARAVIGGLAASMLITLVLVPVAYTLVHPDKREAA